VNLLPILAFLRGKKWIRTKDLDKLWYFLGVCLYIYILMLLGLEHELSWIRLVEMVHWVCPQKSSIQQELWTINIIWPHLPNQVTIQDHWAGANITWQQTQHHWSVFYKKKFAIFFICKTLKAREAILYYGHFYISQNTLA